MSRAAAVRRVTGAYGTFAALVAAVAFILLVVVGLGPVVSGLIAVVIGAVLGSGLYLTADGAALRALGAHRVDPGALPRLDNLVEGLTVAHGFRSPTIYLVDDGAPNAAAVGRTTKHGALVVTSGLLDRLRRIEIEGVLAHELSLIRSGEAAVNVTAGALVGRFFGFSDRLCTTLSGRLLDDDVALKADLAGASLTRYPPGLAAALTSMRRDGRVVKTDPRAYRHLWLNTPEGAISPQSFSLDERIAVLHEL